MQKSSQKLNDIKLFGIQARTNNLNEMNPLASKIMKTITQYHAQDYASRMPGRILSPRRIFCAYTDYESDHMGDYTFFIGEEVSSLASCPEDMTELRIPAQNYAKFTTDPGPMPLVVINAWQQIWAMNPKDMGGDRAYKTDFEIYDENFNPGAAIIDIYIGLK